MIFVFNNPNNIIYNDYIYVFLRSWYMPSVPEFTITGDKWLKLPALRTDMSENRQHYTCCNANAALSALITIAANGSVLRVGRATPNTVCDETVFALIKEDAINVELWERNNNKPWPYDNMFAKTLVKKRYEVVYGTNTTPFNENINDAAYNAISSKLKPKPCNCGKTKVITKI